jgi:hypothetical protein
MKNELILAKYTGQKKRAAGERLLALLREFGVTQCMQARFAGVFLGDAPGQDER